MKLKIGRIGAVILISASTAVALSCASSPPPKKDDPWPESKREDYEHKEDPCMEKGGEPRKCTSTDDCCKGFACSIDPSRSRVFRYCLEG